jgi:hypothetical protein
MENKYERATLASNIDDETFDNDSPRILSSLPTRGSSPRVALTTGQTDDHLAQRVGFQTDAADSIVVNNKVTWRDRDARELRKDKARAGRRSVRFGRSMWLEEIRSHTLHRTAEELLHPRSKQGRNETPRREQFVQRVVI